MNRNLTFRHFLIIVAVCGVSLVGCARVPLPDPYATGRAAYVQCMDACEPPHGPDVTCHWDECNRECSKHFYRGAK